MERMDLIEAMQIIACLAPDDLKEVTEIARQKTARRSEAVCNTVGGDEHAADECA